MVPTLQPHPLRRSTASQNSRSLRASPTAWLMSVADDSSRRTDCSTDASPWLVCNDNQKKNGEKGWLAWRTRRVVTRARATGRRGGIRELKTAAANRLATSMRSIYQPSTENKTDVKNKTFRESFVGGPHGSVSQARTGEGTKHARGKVLEARSRPATAPRTGIHVSARSFLGANGLAMYRQTIARGPHERSRYSCTCTTMFCASLLATLLSPT